MAFSRIDVEYFESSSVSADDTIVGSPFVPSLTDTPFSDAARHLFGTTLAK